MAGHVYNENAYENAIARRIRANAVKGWIAQFGEDKVELIRTYVRKRQSTPGFWADMFASLQGYGRLTERQSLAVLAIIEKNKEKNEARLVSDRETSNHVGTVGERNQFTCTVQFVTSYQTAYGPSYVYGLKDTEGNVIIAKVSKPMANWERGLTLSFSAYVKGHGERDGVKQTIINRIK